VSRRPTKRARQSAPDECVEAIADLPYGLRWVPRGKRFKRGDPLVHRAPRGLRRPLPAYPGGEGTLTRRTVCGRCQAKLIPVEAPGHRCDDCRREVNRIKDRRRRRTAAERRRRQDLIAEH
jgi:hypothetical protein